MIELYEGGSDFFVSKHGIIQLDREQTLSNKQRSFLNLASKIAETSELYQQHGAVIVKGGSVLAVGANKWRNKTLNPENIEGYNPYLTYHAEVDAISRSSSDLTGATIYIARIGKDGEQKFSRPCMRCLKAIKTAGIKKIIYTTESETSYVV